MSCLVVAMSAQKHPHDSQYGLTSKSQLDYKEHLEGVPGSAQENIEGHLFGYLASYTNGAFDAYRQELYKLSEGVRNPMTIYYTQLQTLYEIKRSLDKMPEDDELRSVRLQLLFKGMVTLWYWRSESLKAFKRTTEDDSAPIDSSLISGGGECDADADVATNDAAS